MKSRSEELFQAREFAALTGVTVRTLFAETEPVHPGGLSPLQRARPVPLGANRGP